MSSQSKDNTCPTCGKSRTEMLSRYMAAGGKNTCPSCGSGQQEDKPTTGYVHACQPCNKCDGCVFECEHRVKAMLTHTKAVLEEYEPALKELTDSKPEKPLVQLDKLIEVAPAEYGVPVEPDQLREQLAALGMPHDHVEGDLLIEFIEALLATEYDRGVQVGYKKGLEQNHPYFSQRKAEYDRGKVDGGIEELEQLHDLLKGFDFDTDEKLVGTEAGKRDLREVLEKNRLKSHIIVHLDSRLAELKSKGEVNG